MSGSTLSALLRGLGTYAVLTILSVVVGEIYVSAWLPILKVESQWLLLHGFVCDSLTLLTRNAEHVVQLHSVTTTAIAFESGVLPAGAATRATTLQSYVLSHPVLVYTVLAAWPVPTWRRRIELLMLGIPCVAITTSLDIPFVLTGLLRELVLSNLAPQRVARDALVLYFQFMHNGGRLGLAIVAALLTALWGTHAAAHNRYKKAPHNYTSSPQKLHRPEAPAR